MKLHKLTMLPALIVALVMSGCAANHVHPEFEKRLTGTEKISGLIVRLESTGLERGGMKHIPLPEDESVMFIAMRGMQQLFSEQQLQQMGAAPALHLPEELIEFGYEQSEAERDTKLLAALLKSALGVPEQPVRGDKLEAVRRLASRTGGDIVILGDIRTRRHMSEESRSFSDFLSIIAAAGGQYGVPGGRDSAVSLWAIVDPTDGSVLRTLEDAVRF
jgi:hypothetical protein